MLRYDEKEHTLYAFKNELAIMEPPKREVPANCIALQRYLEEGLIEDLETQLLPLLRSKLKLKNEEDLFIEDYSYDLNPDEGNFNERCVLVKVKWGSTRTSGDVSKFVPILKLPIVDDDGLINIGDKKYSLIHTMEMETSVSYEENKSLLKFKLPRTFVQFTAGSGRVKVEFSTMRSKNSCKKYNAAFLLYALAEHEGYDRDTILEEFHGAAIFNTSKDEQKADMDRFYLGGSEASVGGDEYFDIVKTIKGLDIRENLYGRKYVNPYILNPVRAALNEITSLKHCIGMKLAEDVRSTLDPFKYVGYKGDIITEAMYQDFQRECVYCIYTENDFNLQGKTLGGTDGIWLSGLAEGLEIIPEMRQYIPSDEKGMYLSKDIYFEDGVRWYIQPGTPLNTKLVNMLRVLGLTSINIKGEGQFYFSDVHMSNRCFESKFLANATPGSTYMYLNAQNELVDVPDTFTTYDIAAIMNLITKLRKGECHSRVTNVDSGFRKRLVTLDEQYHKAFNYACIACAKNSFVGITKIWKERNYEFFQPGEISNKFYPIEKEFYRYIKVKSKAFQLLTGDFCVNPIAFVSACTKANIVTKNASDSQRRIPIGCIGKLDVYEIPQSGKMGAVNNITIECNVDDKGVMRTRYYELLRDSAGNIYIDPTQSVYLTTEEEEGFCIADICTLDMKKNSDGTYSVLNQDAIVLARVPSYDTVDNTMFSYTSVNSVKYVNASALSTLSWATASIPFMGSNDAARAIFGVSQTKQAKGLVNPKKPRVSTFVNKYLPHINKEYCIFAEGDGRVTHIRRDTEYSNNKVEIFIEYDDPDIPNERRVYDEYYSSGYSVTVRTLKVNINEEFKKGDLILTSNFIEDGYLAMGRDALIGYLPNGYNYEDGVNTSYKFCNELLSYRVNKGVIENPTPKNKIVISKNYKASWIEANPEDNELSETTVKSAGVMGRLSYSDSNTGASIKGPKFISSDSKGFLESCSVITEEVKKKGGRKEVRYLGVAYDLISIDPYGSGDKMANRHGNKGVCPKPELNSKMPRLMNGQILDMCYNPHGIPSRMNGGQTHECNLTLGLHILNVDLIVDAFNTITDEEIIAILHFAIDMADSSTDAEVEAAIAKYDILPMALRMDAKANINKIRFWKGCFNKKGEAYILNPKKGNRLSETPILVGLNHVYKLVWESEIKHHARAGAMYGEKYNTVYNAPPRGHSEGGGQRVGEMEMDGLASYGASSLIWEAQNVRGDNPIVRNNAIVDAYLPNSVKDNYKIFDGDGDENDGVDYTSWAKGQRRSTTQFLYTALALGLHFSCDENEFYPIAEDNGDMFAWSTNHLKKAGIFKENKGKGKGNKGNKYNNNNNRKPQSPQVPSSTELDLQAKPLTPAYSLNRLAMLGGAGHDGYTT